MRTEQGNLYLLVASDRTSKFAFVELHEKATRRVAADFLRHLAAAVPYRIHTVPTDNGTHFTDTTGNGWTHEDIKEMRAKKLPFLCHAFEAARPHLSAMRNRPSQRPRGRPPRPDTDLVADIRLLVADLPTYGYRRVHALLRRQAEKTGRTAPNPNAFTAL